MVIATKELQEQFMRIAMTRLNGKCRNPEQKLAIAAKMFMKYLRRIEERGKPE